MGAEAKWPAEGQKAWLKLPCCNALHVVRVETPVEGVFSVSAPSYPHSAPVEVPSASSSSVFLSWEEDAATLEQGVSVLAETRLATRTWQIAPSGPIRVASRRAFVRWEVNGAVAYLSRRGIDELVSAQVLDLSEGGMRVRLPSGYVVPKTARIAIKLKIGVASRKMNGHVIWTTPGEDDAYVDGGIQFVSVVSEDTDFIRRAVLAAQRAADSHVVHA